MQRLPDAEFTIMKIVWQYNGKVTSSEVMSELKGKKDWVVTTVLNLLARLVDRGFLQVQKQGKSNIYTALICEDTYLETESKSFLERVHGNSLKSFMAALYGSKTMNEDDISELRRYLDEMAGEPR